VSFLLALVICFFLSKSRKNYLLLPELPRVRGAGELDITVVIPARNEELNIARCVESFIPLGVRVVVADVEADVVARFAGVTEEDQVARLQVTERDALALAPLESGVVREVDPSLGPRHLGQA
jgi:cellulose synthase/poly-beta-1,6-N-acetylglucosamine synthase-like glycosyltransferase